MTPAQPDGSLGPRDEWTMICPPGRMDEAIATAEIRPENIREIIESPVAVDQFILINDSEQARFWEAFRNTPIFFRDPPRVSFGPVFSDPAALTRLSGI